MRKICLAVAAFLLAGLGVQAGERVIAFSQMGSENNWRITETNSIQEEAKSRGYRLLYANANDDTSKQVSDVEDLLNRRPDLLIIAPREYEGLAPALQAAREAKVPVVLVDRSAQGEPGVDYKTVISANFIWEGAEAAKVIAAKFNGKPANIVQITGVPGSSVAIERQKGFEDEVAKHANLKIVATQNGDFTRSVAQKTMENIIQAHGNKIDAVYGHDDECAIGALQALNLSGRKPGEVVIVGIGGFRDAAQLIEKGQMEATILCSPFFGPTTFDTVEKILTGGTVPTFIQNPGYVIDSKNVVEYLPKSF
ncbi:MAG: ABC transporter substrate-binding protein [Planctomycetota bacterium]|jgi:ribose transport system substrate-binding protein|nr:ABC transporter substrate-binding protein [Planctomycetota bacterium]